MILSEPLTCIISRTKPHAFFKVDGDKHLLFNGVQTMSIYNDYIDEYIILKNEDVVPFILVHNMRIDATINILETNNKYGRGKNLLNIVKEARIDNELNTNLTVKNVYDSYDTNIITYDELYLWLIIDAQNKNI